MNQLFEALGFTNTGGFWVFNNAFKAQLEKGLALVNLEFGKLPPTKFAYNTQLPWKPAESHEQSLYARSYSLPQQSLSQPSAPQLQEDNKPADSSQTESADQKKDSMDKQAEPGTEQVPDDPSNLSELPS